MSDNEKRTKSKYEAPVVVPLGEMSRGAGTCANGSTPDDSCGSGFGANTSCGSGVTAGTTCGTGTTGN
jgi:hypothetical protein